MRKMILGGALAAAAVAVAIGTASTASNTIPDRLVGYDSSTISGAEASSVVYNRSADLKTITSVDLIFVGDLTGAEVDADFNGGTSVRCGAAVFTTGTPGSSAVTCTFTTPQDVTTATNFNVAVQGAPAVAAT
jgi:hypothetical protein